MKNNLDKKPFRIAFYGKGGIGKSTIAANFSAAMGKRGYRVLHIGCDPKADSARLLTGRKIPDVLSVLAKKSQISREDLVSEGIYKVQCVEAGGPKAGTGCAGLGITATMDQLGDMGILQEPWDIMVYDVLGDVVCGGFAAPMRRKLADAVCVVTSSDYMSLYAANNILKGIAHFQRKKPLFSGLIQNHCRGERDQKIMNTFADRLRATVLGAVHESEEIRRADFRAEILTEKNCSAQAEMERIADAIMSRKTDMVYSLSEKEMEEFRNCIFQEMERDYL
ncbi:MAG: AAA family ATPase [Ruminococcus sp.]|jgi:nitrogenase iron protein NifH